ncbi:MAG: hypothetical protein QM784_07300 [Polyangiaceae bacterium]
MTTRRIMNGLTTAGVMFFAVACAGGEDVESSDVGQAEQSVVGQDTYLYFQSNATGWGVDVNTRLLSFAAPHVFAKRFDVKEAWMVSGLDNAILTETNALDGWGTSQTYYGLVGSNVLSVPSTVGIQPTSAGSTFQVDYANTGRHRVLVNFNTSPVTVQIESEASICSTVGCPANYTHCTLLDNGVPTCVPN